MKNRIQKIHNLFIRRMLYSLIAQLLILGLVIFLFRNYTIHTQTNMIAENLLVKDEYTIDKIGQYRLLGADYALNLELHNLGDTRKLDSIKFVKNINSEIFQKNILNSHKYILQKNHSNRYSGITEISVNKKVLGYIIAQKNYSSVMPVSIEYDLFLIFSSIIGIFLINFGFLLIPIKKKIERNTRFLVSFISSQNSTENILASIDIEEYQIVAHKFLDERDETNRLHKEKLYYEARKNIAEQVAHDMCSPIAAINIVINERKNTYCNEEINVIRSSLSRLNYIANNLISSKRSTLIPDIHKQYQCENNEIQAEPIFFLVDSLISEKQYEYNYSKLKINFHFPTDACNAFTLIYSEEIKTVLSNIINNAVEASYDTGNVDVYLKSNSREIEIDIIDEGKGIPKDILSKVTQNGFSFGKQNGSGLGLYHALLQIEKVGGLLSIDSQEGIGTRVSIKLKRIPAPSWFCEKISLRENSKLVIIDDDPSIHDAWLIKLEGFRKINILNYYNSRDILTTVNQLGEDTKYLIDYELYDENTGIDIINTLAIHNDAILVTNNFKDKEIIRICENLKIQLLPKPFMKYVSIMSV